MPELVKKLIYSLSVIIILFGVGLIIYICMNEIREENQPVKYELLAINIGSHINGTFFLGCGGIGDNTEFYFYVKDSSGAINLKKEDINFVTIYENINQYERSYAVRNDIRWYVHIPPNSILREANLNLEGIK